MHWKATSTLLLLLIGLTWPAVAQSTIQNDVEQALRSRDLGGAAVSVFVADARSGKVLANLRADEPMIPASNMKLITTAAALDALGVDYTFKTRLLHLPATEHPGKGDRLVVVGDGDPGFADPKLLKSRDETIDAMLKRWTDAVAATGVRRIAELIVDDRAFDRQFVHPTWPSDQLQHWYCAQVAGLNFHDNVIEVHPLPTQAGQSPQIVLVPEARFVNANNKAVTGNVNTFWVSRTQGTNNFVYAGVVKHRLASPAEVTVHDPPMFFLRVLKERLEAAGITVDRISRPADDQPSFRGKVLVTEETKLTDIIARANKSSQNLFAEALLKRAGREVTGSVGSWDSGAAAVRIFLKERLGSRASVVRVADGSGLSRDNQVTARILSDLLRDMFADEKLGPTFINSLAVGGIDGSLRKRLRETPSLRGRVLAKSGYINGVVTLSGYLILSRDGKPLSADDETPLTETLDNYDVLTFSILINGFKPPVYPFAVCAFQDELLQVIDRAIEPTTAGRPRPEPLGG